MFRMLILASFFILTGCSALHIISEPVDKPALNIEYPAPLELDDIEFYVLTKDNAIQVLDELEKKGLKPVIIGLSGKGYKVLALNIDKIKNHIELLNEIIKKYKEYYEVK